MQRLVGNARFIGADAVDIFCGADCSGYPQWIQLEALSDTSLPHSGHLMSIASLPFLIGRRYGDLCSLVGKPDFNGAVQSRNYAHRVSGFDCLAEVLNLVDIELVCNNLEA